MTVTLRFEKVVPSGQALAYHDGKALFCMGPVPGETCEVNIVKTASSYILARLVKVVESSTHRTGKGALLPYAPWASLDYEYQLELKAAMLGEAFGRLDLKIAGVIPSPIKHHYRNKLTFALRMIDGQLKMGMYERRSRSFFMTPDGCSLGDAKLNTMAEAVYDRLRAMDGAELVESLRLRTNQIGDIVAVVMLKKRKKADWQSLRVPGLAGLIVRTKDERVWSIGMTTLTDAIGTVEVDYPADEFMQVNLPAFELALKAITEQITPDNKVMDLYGGAGAIGLPLAQTTGATVLGVEINAESVRLAKAAAERQAILNYKVTTASADALEDTLFDGIDTVIVDPPRAGLSRQLTDQLLRLAPQRIIYLSCDPTTQARDVAALAVTYSASEVTGYDFYPQTPHTESLIILNKQ